jgi:hypothetical protein
MFHPGAILGERMRLATRNAASAPLAAWGAGRMRPPKLGHYPQPIGLAHEFCPKPQDRAEWAVCATATRAGVWHGSVLRFLRIVTGPAWLPLSMQGFNIKQLTHESRSHGRSSGVPMRSPHLTQKPPFSPDLPLKLAGMQSARFLHNSYLRVSPTRVCGLGGARMSSTSGLRFVFTHRVLPYDQSAAKG